MNGLSFDTRGREWDFVTPRSLRSSATVPAIIGPPRSAWIVNRSRSTPSRLQVSVISRRAIFSDSRSAIVQPTTLREKMSMIVYKK